MMNKYKWLKDISELLNSFELLKDKERFFYGRKKKFKRSSYFLEKFFLKEIKLNLPSDSEIHIRYEKEGLIVVSEEKQVVFKIFTSSHYVESLKKEINILSNKSQDFIPKLIAADAGAGYIWAAIEFNKTAKKPTVQELFFFEHPLVMRNMAEFYRASSPQFLSVPEWLAKIEQDYNGHPFQNDLEKIKETILSYGNLFDFRLMLTEVHGDLHKDNLIFDKSGVKIIDWEGTNRELVIIDYFDFLRRYLMSSKSSHKKFWNFILNNDESLPSEFKSFFDGFRVWSETYFSWKIPEGRERILFFIYIMDRTVSLIRARDKHEKHVYEFQTFLNFGK